jgi:hypothetical protein
MSFNYEGQQILNADCIESQTQLATKPKAETEESARTLWQYLFMLNAFIALMLSIRVFWFNLSDLSTHAPDVILKFF